MEDRRHTELDEKHWWASLNCAQQVSANSLSNVGYELAFIRDGNTAVFRLDDSVVTVDIEGDPNLNPNITIR
ncbi:hypothetical protein [Algibacillus agarilyticus]|uniref:hypothetical protein n=1 Tax=Algibacillus agarilyticus TaxID=2234133 RepID=UPI000DCFB0C0|nr:hypothetical protein [Algibacillus agarilyticus]